MSRSAIRTVVFAVGFVIVYAAAVLTPLGQQLDAATLGAFGWLSPVGRRAAGPLRDLLAVAAGVVAIATVAWLLIRRRSVDAMRITIAVAAVAGGGELLKQFALGRPWYGDFGYAQNTLPSVHAAFVAVGFTAALSALTDSWRRRLLSWVAFVAAFLAALVGPVSYAHRAGDSLAALLLVGVAELLLPARSRAPRSRHPLRVIAAAAAGLAAAVGIAFVVVAARTGADDVLGVGVTLLFAGAAASVTLAA
ncbi:hypothetical protein ACFOYW_09985 [Gryllotalpicola reticulitermitis]|uniref:PAP2 superfamily protein n=1 Tax=Gryllotalpicola reticulitermitis TaxID=1184153 RepID=A0ABV8Q7X3_9MICO